MDPYDWLNKFYRFYMAIVVGIVSRQGLTVEGHCINQPNKCKLRSIVQVMNSLYRHLQHLYTNNKTEHFSYKGGCGIAELCVLRHLKAERALATDKLLQVISHIMLFKQLYH